MLRRDFLKAMAQVGSALMLGACAGRPFRPSPPAARPNFLFILVDDLGWRDLGCFGSTFYETPNIDRLCARGMSFTKAYAAAPVCSPTRASIMSGKYPARLGATQYFGAPQYTHPDGVMPLLNAYYNDRLPLEEVTLAEALKAAGYATSYAGKWHLGPESHYPEHQGFDINKGGCDWGMPPTFFSPYGNNPRLSDGPPGEHLPDRLARETIDFIERHHQAHPGQPFLSFLSFYHVHIPLEAREDLKRKYEAKAAALASSTAWGAVGQSRERLTQDHAVYAAMVEALDQAVGKVADALARLRLDDNTMIVFMSDNGGLSTAQGWPTSNRPLRAGKGWLYEGGIREPMFIVWPRAVPAGGVCETPVISTDFYPTMLEAAGLPPQPAQHADGLSLMPLLKGRSGLKRDTLYWHYPHYSGQGGSPCAAIRQGDWKLIEFFEDGRQELYNLKDDPGESANLAAAHPETARRLRAALRRWQKDLGARFPSANPAYTADK